MRRLGLVLLLALAAPLEAQRPAPVGQQRVVRPTVSLEPVRQQVNSAARRMGSGATQGMAIGFFAGFVGVELLGYRVSDEEKGLVHFYGLCVGVVAGWIGYMIGRARD